MDLRYLKWNGVYSLAGCCNAVHAPIDTTAQASAYSRLRALGFVLDAKDLADDAGKAAIRRALAMLGPPANPHVKIRFRVTTNDCRIDVSIPLSDTTTLKKAFAANVVDLTEVIEPCGLAAGQWSFELHDTGPAAFATVEIAGWMKEDWKVHACARRGSPRAPCRSAPPCG